MANQMLVVCYSRTGMTRLLGERIARALDADFDCIEDAERRVGVFGYARSAIESIARGLPTIRYRCDPANYARVVVGSPVWAGSMCSPVRSYLLTQAGNLRLAGAFAVMGGMGGEQALREMTLGAAEVLPTCLLREHEVRRGDMERHYAGFVQALRSAAEASGARAGAVVA